MSDQSEQINLRLDAARLARMNAQRMRLLAAERAEKLERQLKDAAEFGLRTEISRGIAARARVRAAAAKNKRTARYAGIAAFGLMICAATLGVATAPARNAPAQAALTPAHVPNTVPGDRLKLSLSYSVSLPATR